MTLTDQFLNSIYEHPLKPTGGAPMTEPTPHPEDEPYLLARQRPYCEPGLKLHGLNIDALERNLDNYAPPCGPTRAALEALIKCVRQEHAVRSALLAAAQAAIAACQDCRSDGTITTDDGEFMRECPCDYCGPLRQAVAAAEG